MFIILAVMVLIGTAIPQQIYSDRSDALQLKSPLSSLSDTSDLKQIKSAIREVSIKYGVEYEELIRVINCESGFKNSARGKAGEIGLSQFMPATWELWNKQRKADLDIYNIQHQLDMMAWAFSLGYQRHWTCYIMNY